jgi:hypothetical protein
MKAATVTGIRGALIAVAIGVPSAWAAKEKPAPETPLTGAGQKLEARYAEQLQRLKAEIAPAVPSADEQKKAALQEARAAVGKAESVANAAQQALGRIQAAKGLVDHAKGKWIGGAEKGIAQAEAARKKATTETEREAARAELAKWQANKEDGLKALKERQEALDKVRGDEPRLSEANRTAQEALAKAQADEQAAAKALLGDVGSFLASDKLDAKLVTFVAMSEATPRGLAQFAEQGPGQSELLETLLADSALLKQMVLGGGAQGGRYGRAREIYAAIRKASARAREGAFQRLALAVALEHAVPIAQSNPKAATNAPAIVDPVKRYLHYEKACLDGELDPGFKTLDVWEYRRVVYGSEPDETLAWGRAMLRNYRPDHVLNPDYGWRYSGAVRTDVPYGSQNVKYDRPNLQEYQNIILNGGVCGRRAFFGRFILRCFGVPTAARPQPRHAALVHWTPDGWVINLGAGWGAGRIDNAPDTDFRAMTQARRVPAAYLEAQRARWVSCVLGEPAADNKKDTRVAWWRTLALFREKAAAEEAKPADLGALGAELGEANESAEARAKAVAGASPGDRDKTVAVAPNGTITVPAAACAGGNHLVKSFLGGQQMICGGPVTVSVRSPRAGAYALTARVVTVHNEQRLRVTGNDGKGAVDMLVPYTCGLWETTQPVTVMLAQGENTLNIAKPATSFALRDFTLTPVKQ